MTLEWIAEELLLAAGAGLGRDAVKAFEASPGATREAGLGRIAALAHKAGVITGDGCGGWLWTDPSGGESGGDPDDAELAERDWQMFFELFSKEWPSR